MGMVTAILAQKKNKSRVNLYVDGEFCCGLDAFTVAKHRLKVGAEILKEELERIAFDSECASAFEKAAGILNIRMRSACEVRAYLADKAYTEAVTEHTIEKLSEYGLISDALFAKMYADSYRTRWGIKKIEFELKRMGVDAEVVEAALTELSDQSEDAYRLALRFLGKKTTLDRRKLYAHLAQKGFESSSIMAAIGRLCDEMNENTD